VDIGATANDGVSTAGATASAIAIANAINAKTAEHGVTAQAEAAVHTSFGAVVGGTFDAVAQKLTINGVDIFDASITVTANDGTSTLRDAINAKTNQTGVSASVDVAGKLILTAADGRNINIVTTGSIGDELGLQAANGDYSATTGGKVKVTSGDPIVVSGTNPGFAGLAMTTYTKDINTAINHLTVGTVTGANLAIDIVDNALSQINNIRANLGAITNRLEQTVQNLQSISENLSASDSRIRDADFAVETANMTRNQILQQAGIAILSQANTSTQSALQLLKGQ
jgi:flagellin